MIHQGTARYPVTEIIAHCAETRAEWMVGHALAEKVAEIRRWHVEQRGWRDIGYTARLFCRLAGIARDVRQVASGGMCRFHRVGKAYQMGFCLPI